MGRNKNLGEATKVLACSVLVSVFYLLSFFLFLILLNLFLLNPLFSWKTSQWGFDLLVSFFSSYQISSISSVTGFGGKGVILSKLAFNFAMANFIFLLMIYISNIHYELD